MSSARYTPKPKPCPVCDEAPLRRASRPAARPPNQRQVMKICCVAGVGSAQDQ